MTTKYSPAIATEIIQQYSAAPELLVQILHAFIARFSYISERLQQFDRLRLS